jgi:hypothetical protein
MPHGNRDDDGRDLAPAPAPDDPCAAKSATLDELVDRFIARDAKVSVWETFQQLLDACSQIHARDCTDAAPQPSLETRRLVHGGPLAHAYDGMPAEARDVAFVPAFPLERRLFASTQYVEAIGEHLGGATIILLGFWGTRTRSSARSGTPNAVDDFQTCIPRLPSASNTCAPSAACGKGRY